MASTAPVDHRAQQRLAVAAGGGQFVVGHRDSAPQVDAEDLPGRHRVGPFDLDLHVEAPRPQDGRVDEVLAVGGPDDDDVLEPLDAVELRQELGHDRRFHVGRHPAAPGAEQGVHLVEEDDDGNPLVGLLLGPGEDQADLPLGLAHVLVEQLGPFDVEEVGTGVARAGLGGHRSGQGVGHRLGDQRLAAPRGPVEQHPLRGAELVVLEELLVQVGQLDRVADRLDLRPQAPDLLVGDVGDLLQDQLFDLGAHQALVDEPAAPVEAHRVAHPQRLLGHRPGQAHHPLLASRPDHDDPPVGHDVPDGGHLAGRIEGPDVDHAHGLVEQHLLAPLQLLDLDGRLHSHPQLPPPGEHVERAVGVDPVDDAEGVRRGGELLHLGAQQSQLFAGLLEGRRQALVLRHRLGQPPLRFEQALLEDPHPARGILEASPQDGDLLLEHLDGLRQFVAGALVCSHGPSRSAGGEYTAGLRLFWAGLRRRRLPGSGRASTR